MEGKNRDCIEMFIWSLNEHPDLWKEYERLWDCKFISRSPIEIMIDKQTGHEKQVLEKAFKFFLDYIWFALPEECFEDSKVA